MAGDTRFAGTWNLVDAYAETDGKRKTFALGEGTEGRIMYDAAGNMAAQLMNPTRSPMSSRNPSALAPEEFREAYLGYTAYYGVYEVDDEAGTITHHVTGALTPNWVGTDQVRYFELEGNRVKLRTPPMTTRDGSRAVNVLIWERMD